MAIECLDSGEGSPTLFDFTFVFLLGVAMRYLQQVAACD
jgi:hypothetical protein